MSNFLGDRDRLALLEPRNLSACTSVKRLPQLQRGHREQPAGGESGRTRYTQPAAPQDSLGMTRRPARQSSIRIDPIGRQSLIKIEHASIGTRQARPSNGREKSSPTEETYKGCEASVQIE
ncbi:hypothetical protein Bbelb_336960 [Branchiostoma belcheri]|nr:hypothetical protein Bbelb_336960 [Branchiostoma belcheri]